MATLQSNSRVGPYVVLASLGAGGMGAVYRARDTKLERDVALKVLPDEFAHDPDRLSRFRREAQVLASLNHPHIGQIYGLEESAGVPCLVLELVEGQTLEQRVGRGPVPVEEALEIARQIAEGMEAAHERGIIHRDLKPANIKLTPDGHVKVLDFGLAKVFESEIAAENMSQSPTRLSGPTQPNVLLGTLPYMSPEQVRGKLADERSDIWAFACVLYELLTGKRAFTGDSAADTIGAITKSDPDWAALPESTPLSIRTLLRRCLQKDRTRRLHHLADARLEIVDALAEPPVAGTAAKRSGSSRGRWITALTAGAVLGAALMFTGLYFRSTPIQEPKMRLEIGTPGKSDYFEISPDARLLVFDLSSPGKSHLWLRPMDTGISRQLPETEDAFFPFWSPDSRSLGFFANSKLKRIEVAGGPAQIIADAPNPRGGAWNSQGTIVFNAASNGPLSRISSAGGTAVPATRLEKDQGSHRYPQFLPDGRHFIYFALGKPEVSGVYVGSLDSLDSKRLMASESQAVYAPPGYLLFLRQELLLAQQFDANKLEFTGEPFPQAEHVGGTYTGSMAVSVASNGTIAYRTGAGKDSRLTWMDRSGKDGSNVGPVGKWFGLALSPDETRIATQRQENGNVDLWLVEVARGITTRLTTDAADDEGPVWSPDGKRIAFDSNRRGTFDLYQTATGGAGAEIELLKSPQTKIPDSWSSDGHYLLFGVNDEKTGDDLWVLPLLGGGNAFPIAKGSSDQTSGSFSPNNRWIAFESNESGRPEVYVQAFPEAGEKWQVSVDGGGDPQWRADGKEIFYVGLDGTLMAAPVSIPIGGKQIEPGKPVPLFHTRIVIGRGRSHQYAVTRDGQRFLLIVPVETAPPPITVLLNWAKR